jgi:hypothetical protein
MLFGIPKALRYKCLAMHEFVCLYGIVRVCIRLGVSGCMRARVCLCVVYMCVSVCACVPLIDNENES